jgi:hypothetical protein
VVLPSAGSANHLTRREVIHSKFETLCIFIYSEMRNGGIPVSFLSTTLRSG